MTTSNDLILSNIKSEEVIPDTASKGSITPATSRTAAKALGLHTYSTGKACSHGHLAARYTSSGNCVVCSANSARKWEAKNPEKLKEARRKYHRAYRRRDPDLTAAWSGWGLARKRGAQLPEGKRPVDVVRETVPLYKKARELTASTGVRHEVDHVVSIRLGGLHCASNLQIVSKSFNIAKNVHTNEEIIESVLAGEWSAGLSRDLIKIAAQNLADTLGSKEPDDHDSRTITAASWLAEAIETDIDYYPRPEVIRGVFTALGKAVASAHQRT